MAGSNRKRKLVVTGQKPITNMKLRTGGTATIYEVFAKTPEGDYVEEALRSFTELDIGQVLEYSIEPYNHPVHGMSYTLTPPKKEFARRLREMEEEFASIKEWAAGKGWTFRPVLGPEQNPPSPQQVAEAEAEKRESQKAEDEKWGADPQWGSLDEELEQHAQTGSTEPPKETDEEAAGGDSDVHDEAGAPGLGDGHVAGPGEDGTQPGGDSGGGRPLPE